MEVNTILCGRCEELVPLLAPASVDFVFTSPPYAKQRASFYGGVSEQDYPDWTVAWMEACRPALKEGASVCIVIRPHIHKGVLSDYVLRTRLAIRDAGWFECDELIWAKPNSPPIGNNKRPRRAWESILWFSQDRQPYCAPKENGQPSRRIGMKSKKGRHKYISGADLPQDWVEVEGIARCRDYVEVGTAECDYSDDNKHPAQFPVPLARWAVKLFCPAGGVVLDPFIGSGTTAVACLETGRKFLGVDSSEEYCSMARRRVDPILHPADAASTM